MDSSKLFSYGWRPKLSMEEGIQIAYDEFRGQAATDNA
jgi:nucleoside-diphosphate-sugar epimerase